MGVELSLVVAHPGPWAHLLLLLLVDSVGVDLSRFNLFSREVSGGTCMSVLNSHVLYEHGIPAIVLLHDEGQGRVVLALEVEPDSPRSTQEP